MLMWVKGPMDQVRNDFGRWWFGRPKSQKRFGILHGEHVKISFPLRWIYSIERWKIIDDPVCESVWFRFKKTTIHVLCHCKKVQEIWAKGNLAWYSSWEWRVSNSDSNMIVGDEQLQFDDDSKHMVSQNMHNLLTTLLLVPQDLIH